MYKNEQIGPQSRKFRVYKEFFESKSLSVKYFLVTNCKSPKLPILVLMSLKEDMMSPKLAKDLYADDDVCFTGRVKKGNFQVYFRYILAPPSGTLGSNKGSNGNPRSEGHPGCLEPFLARSRPILSVMVAFTVKKSKMYPKVPKN